MVKIEAVIRPHKLDDVKAALESLAIEDITLYEILDHSPRVVHPAAYRGRQYLADIPRVKLEFLVSSERADEVIDTVLRAARTSVPGDDGTILAYELTDAVRIRSGARLQYTLA